MRYVPCMGQRLAGNLDYDVSPVNGHGIGLSDVWPLFQVLPLPRLRMNGLGLAGLKRDVVAPHPHSSRVEPGLPRADVELPSMPRTSENLASPAHAIVAWSGRREKAGDRPLAQFTTLVRTAVPQGEELTVEVEDADGSPGDINDLPASWRYLVDLRNDVPAHAACLNPAPAYCLCSALRSGRAKPHSRP